MKKINIIIISVCTLLVSLLLCSCVNNTHNDENADVNVENNKTEITDVTQPQKVEVQLPEQEPQPVLPPEPKYYSILTGLECEKTLLTLRPYAVMMDNLKVATPQNGISNADIVYEVKVEGDITRLLAVFSDYTSDYTIGAVRSSRDYFIDLAQAHGAVYVHAGGSPEAYSTLYSRKINNLDGVNNGPASSFWRDKERRQSRLSSEHCMVTNPQKVSEGIEIKKYKTELAQDFVSPFSFYEADTDIEGSSALKVQIPFSSKSMLEYDATAKLYNKFQYGDAHKDRNTDTQLTFKNILILNAAHSSTGDEKGRIKVDLTGSGSGYYAAGGVYKEIVWKKENRTTPYALFEKDGQTPLLLCPGKSYVAVVPTKAKISFE